MSKRNKPVEEFESIMDVVTYVMEDDDMDDEERLFQLKLLIVLNTSWRPYKRSSSMLSIQQRL
jgi:hypothetical protein